MFLNKAASDYVVKSRWGVSAKPLFDGVLLDLLNAIRLSLLGSRAAAAHNPVIQRLEMNNISKYPKLG
jgi:hypothetical protein